MTYAAWYSMAFHLTLVLVVVFITAYYAGSYYDHVQNKADDAHRGRAAEAEADRRGTVGARAGQVVPMADEQAEQAKTSAGGSLEKGQGVAAAV